LASEGLLQDSLRIRVWPHLLGIQPADLELDYKTNIYKHRDWDQVERDVERSLLKLDKSEQVEKRKELSTIIHSILSLHTDLNYYQGFHDIASVLLLVCGEKQPSSKKSVSTTFVITSIPISTWSNKSSLTSFLSFNIWTYPFTISSILLK